MKNLFRVHKVILLKIIFSFILAGCPSGRKKGGPSTGGYGSSKSYIIDEEYNYISNSLYLTDGLSLK